MGVLLALTYAQPQRQDILQDQPQGITGSQAGSLPYKPEVPSEEGGGMRNSTEPVPSLWAHPSRYLQTLPLREMR